MLNAFDNNSKLPAKILMQSKDQLGDQRKSQLDDASQLSEPITKLFRAASAGMHINKRDIFWERVYRGIYCCGQQYGSTIA